MGSFIHFQLLYNWNKLSGGSLEHVLTFPRSISTLMNLPQRNNQRYVQRFRYKDVHGNIFLIMVINYKLSKCMLYL